MILIDNHKYGWECPKCGAVMSPDTIVCINCQGAKNKTTYYGFSSFEGGINYLKKDGDKDDDEHK